MKSRQEFMAEIDFETRRKHIHRSMDDVTLTVLKKKNGGSRVNIYFRNGTKDRFPDGVMFGIYKNRIIFEPNAQKGFKIATNSTNRTDYGYISAVLDGEKYKAWIGDYQMLFDEFYEFWYIEKKEEQK